MTVPLLGTHGSLSSSTIIINNGDGPNATPSNSEGDFLYASDSAEFRQVTAFYHAQKFLLDFMPTAGFKGLDHPLVIETNSPGIATGYNYQSKRIAITDKHCFV